MTSYGTLAWASARDGRLTRKERFRELVAAQLLLARSRFGRGATAALELDVDSVPLPDSTIAREAETACREASPPSLLNHCVRTYVWGSLLGQADGITPDPELLYVAAMLHDLALTDTHRHANPMPCFGARGGLLARDWATGHGWTEDKATKLGDAISLHLNVRVDPAHGPEARLLHAGAGFDVIGLRAKRLSTATIDAVQTRYPRHDLLALLDDFKQEARPGTRTQLLVGPLRFVALARRSPLL